MLQPSIQIIIVILTSFTVGLGIGIAWLVFFSRRSIREQELEQELAGLNSNYRQMREDTHELYVKLKTTQEKLAKSHLERQQLLHLLKTTSGHKNFLKVRRQLETARLQIQVLTTKLHHREQQIFDLTDILHTLRKHLRLRGKNRTPALTAHVLQLPKTRPALTAQQDDLQQIAGIDAHIARQLNSLGITRYRQLAECSPQHLATLQKMMGKDQILPLKQWTQSAQRLLIDPHPKAQHAHTQPLVHSRSA